MKNLKWVGSLMLAGLLSVGAVGTSFADAQVGAPYTGRQENGPGAETASGISLSEEEQAVKTALQAAIDKTNTIGSYQIEGSMTMDMQMSSLPEQQFQISMPYTVRYSGVNTDHVRFLMTADMNMLGQSIPMTAFYTDGYYYVDTAGVKQKMALSLEESMKQTQQLAGFDVANDTAGLTNLNLVEQNGIRTVYYTYDTDYLNRFVEEAMQSLAGSFSALGLGYSCKVTNCVGEMSINADNYLVNERVSMDLEMDMSYGEEAESVQLKAYTEANYINPGQDVSVTLPSTEGFEDITAAPGTIQ